MIGTSFGEWVLIRLSIVLFRYTPALYLFSLCLLALFAESSLGIAIAEGALIGALSVEALFFALIYRPYMRRMSKAAAHPDPLSQAERWALFERCFEHVPSTEAYLTWWFLGADVSEIRRENVEEFLLWAFFELDIDKDEMSPDVVEELGKCVRRIEDQLGHPLEPGRGSAKALRLTFDDIETTYRSLLWYIIVFIVDQFTHLMMVWKGFQYYAATSQEVFPPRPQQWLSSRQSPVASVGYWYSPHRAANKRPVLFFHGIGIGLLVYIEYFAKVASTGVRGGGDIGLIAVEMLPISFRLTAEPLSRTEFMESMAIILDHHKWDHVTMVSHSYGSVPITQLLSSPAMQKRVRSVVLIDPVTIMLHLPDVAYNFTRRRPRRANEWQLWFFASTDPGVAHCLARHFFWRQNIIWKEELLGSSVGSDQNTKRRVAVFLAGRDLISDTAAIASYLEADGEPYSRGLSKVEVTMFPRLDHAQVFDSPSERGQVVDRTRSYCEIE